MDNSLGNSLPALRELLQKKGVAAAAQNSKAVVTRTPAPTSLLVPPQLQWGVLADGFTQQRFGMQPTPAPLHPTTLVSPTGGPPASFSSSIKPGTGYPTTQVSAPHPSKEG